MLNFDINVTWMKELSFFLVILFDHILLDENECLFLYSIFVLVKTL